MRRKLHDDCDLKNRSGFGKTLARFWLAILVTVFGTLGIAVGIILEIVYGGTIGGVSGFIRKVVGIVIPLYLMRDVPKKFFGKSPVSTKS